MNKKWTRIALTASLLIMTSAGAAQATALRAFVASYGSDANLGANCPQATPCRTFNVAIGAVTAGGELIALDTSGYGPITSVNKAITIAAIPGHTAFVVSATGTSGFTIAGAASDLIKLRNISFNGSGAASTTGVQHNSGKLVVQDCSFQQLTTGIVATNSKALLIDSDFVGNTTAIKADGQGCDTTGAITCGNTHILVAGGNVTDNGTAFLMANPGTSACPGGFACPPTIPQNRTNILLLLDNNTVRTHVIHNATITSGSGATCSNDPNHCKNTGTYNFGSPIN